MNTETMNIHSALIELKTLDARITKDIDAMTPVFIKEHQADNISGVPEAKVKQQILAGHQSIMDKIARRNAIKVAVIQSNANTQVTVMGTTYSVAQAIDLKDIVARYYTELISNYGYAYKKALQDCDRANGTNLESRAKVYVDSSFKNVTDAGAIKQAYDEFVKNHTTEVVDPIQIEAFIRERTEYCDNFLKALDTALNTSNALTEITIEY